MKFIVKTNQIAPFAGLVGLLLAGTAMGGIPYPIVDTGQERCYDNSREIACPLSGESVLRTGCPDTRASSPPTATTATAPSRDLVTGLMWQQDPGEKMTYDQAVAGAATCRTGGHADWRLPTHQGTLLPDPVQRHRSRSASRGNSGLKPFIDNTVFAISIRRGRGRATASSTRSSPPRTKYVSTTMGGNETMFGVNFADGRIKGYPTGMAGPAAAQNIPRALRPRQSRLREQPLPGQRRRHRHRPRHRPDVDAGRQRQSGMNWKDGPGLCRKPRTGRPRRLAPAQRQGTPEHRRLHPLARHHAAPPPSIRSSPAPPITNEAGQKDFACYWTGTTHPRGPGHGAAAVYVAFGRALGCMHGHWMDVHGAGCPAQRSESRRLRAYPQGRGPQGDVIRIDNFVRCVRGGLL